MDMQLDGDGAAYIIESMEAVSEVAECTCKCIVDTMNETTDRVPMSDWYFTTNAEHRYFINRTVVGGMFINLL